jgi:hypothetical protein
MCARIFQFVTKYAGKEGKVNDLLDIARFDALDGFKFDVQMLQIRHFGEEQQAPTRGQVRKGQLVVHLQHGRKYQGSRKHGKASGVSI